MKFRLRLVTGWYEKILAAEKCWALRYSTPKFTPSARPICLSSDAITRHRVSLP